MRVTFTLNHDADDAMYGPVTDVQTMVPRAEDLDKILEGFFDFLHMAGYSYITGVDIVSEHMLWSYPESDEDEVE